MPRVLLLLPTTTYRAQAFMEAAQRVGVEVTVASEEASTFARLNPIGLMQLDFADPPHAARKVVEFARQHPLAAVIPVDDQVTVCAATISAALGLRHNSIESADAARNKYRMRELLSQSDVSQPRYMLGSLDEDVVTTAEQVRYPCVVKPLLLAGSQGVIRANTKSEFVRAVDRLDHILSSEFKESRSSVGRGNPSVGPLPPLARQYLIEDFVAGQEVALEGLLMRGELRVLALFDKPDPLEGPFFEETIYVTPSRLSESVQQNIAHCATRACRAMGLSEGPVHAELRIHRDGPSVIEVNPRSIGGLCSRTLRFGTGLSLEELILRQALDENFDPPVREKQASGVMMIPTPRGGILTEARGLQAAQAVAGIEQVTISAHLGQELVPLPESSLYLGFLFARGDTPEVVEAALRESHACLEFLIEPAEVRKKFHPRGKP